MALSPSATNLRSFGILHCSNARRINSTSSSLSSAISMVSDIGSSVGCRYSQIHPEFTAVARGRLHSHSTAHTFGAFLDDGQSNARTGIRFTAVKPFEDRKNPLLMSRFNTNSIVFHPNAHVILTTFCPDPYRRSCPWENKRSEERRVGKECR